MSKRIPSIMTKRERGNAGSPAMSGYGRLKAKPPKLCGAKDCTNKRAKQGYCTRHGNERLSIKYN